MSKVTLKVEIEEDYLESIKASTNKTLSDIILINATPITESDDAVSRQAVLKKLRGCLTGGETEYRYVKLHIDSIHSVIPKCNPNIKTHYFHTDDYCPKESEDKE